MDSYADVMAHYGHNLEVANYANRNAAVECVTCSQVLIDYEREGNEMGECDKCGTAYELSSKDNRCGDCGNCSGCCDHVGEGK